MALSTPFPYLIHATLIKKQNEVLNETFIVSKPCIFKLAGNSTLL